MIIFLFSKIFLIFLDNYFEKPKKTFLNLKEKEGNLDSCGSGSAVDESQFTKTGSVAE